jgi:hypothetical protein
MAPGRAVPHLSRGWAAPQAFLTRVTIFRCNASSSSVVAVPASRLSPRSWEHSPIFRSSIWTTSSGRPGWRRCRPRRGLPHRMSSYSDGPGSPTAILVPTTSSMCVCAPQTPWFCSTSHWLDAPGEPSAGRANAPTSGSGSGATGASGGRGSSVLCRQSHHTPRSTSCARRVPCAGCSRMSAAVGMALLAGSASQRAGSTSSVRVPCAT